MSAKRKCESISLTKKRKWLTLQQKLDIIKLHEDGASFAKIGRDKRMDESSVRTLIKKKEQYKSHGMATPTYLSQTTTKTRSSRMVNMERLLSIWIAQLNQQRIPLSQMEIQDKALSLYNDLKENEGTANEGGETGEIFTASRGWFFRFKKRTGIHNIRMIGECANADTEAALKCPQELNEIIIRECEQILNVDETGMCGQKLSRRTFIATNEKSCPAEVTNDSVATRRELDCKELDSVNVIECNESNNDSLISNLDEERETNLDSTELVEMPTKELTAEVLLKVIGMAETLSEHIMEVDRNVERSITICRVINSAVHCYKDMYEAKRGKDKYVQTSILQFLDNKK